jgi:hypothetical protein
LPTIITFKRGPLGFRERVVRHIESSFFNSAKKTGVVLKFHVHTYLGVYLSTRKFFVGLNIGFYKFLKHVQNVHMYSLMQQS